MSPEMSTILTATGGFGWIPPSERTTAQIIAKTNAMGRMYVTHSLPFFAMTAGQTVILTKAWKHPDVIADIGYEFDGFRQFTGSCVGVSTGGCICCLTAVQRLIADAPTKAFVPWWPYDYGTCRAAEGDSGQGEGAVDSVMFEVLTKGVLLSTEAGLPKFDHTDGLTIPQQMEMQWSDGNSSTVTQWKEKASAFPLGAATVVNGLDDAQTLLGNGYPLLGGCPVYIGHASIQGSGEDAHAFGQFDGSGGHSTCIYGVKILSNGQRRWLYGNTWDKTTYPVDPAGGPRCSCWTDDNGMMRWLSGGQGEAAGLSHQKSFPIQPKVMDWSNYF